MTVDVTRGYRRECSGADVQRDKRTLDADSLQREYALRISAQAGAMENRLDVLEMFRRDCRQATPDGYPRLP